MSRPLLAIPLTALFACMIVSCQQVGPPAGPVARASWPQPDPPAMPNPAPVALASLPPHAPEPLSQEPTPTAPGAMPGNRVVWTDAPRLRVAPSGVGALLADVESHLPPASGLLYRDKDRVTWCHETTHGVHAALRSRYGLAAFYPGGGKCALVKPPAITLGDVAAILPARLRGTRFSVYLVQQRAQWDRDPLYVWDEWVAYDNGTATGIQEGRARPGASDDAVACIELSTYALAVAAAARRKGAPLSEQFREYLAWELRRSLALYSQAMALPAFAWPDRRLEQLWRGGDAFVTEELQALYGDTLTVRDLLP